MVISTEQLCSSHYTTIVINQLYDLLNFSNVHFWRYNVNGVLTTPQISCKNLTR